jgi:cyclopropane fatty-acyl-phospholipid synthase-like methyltransferase
MANNVYGLMRKAARRSWMKFALKGVSANDNYERLDLAYKIADPWNMESAMEQARFAATDRLIESAFGRVGSMLELGCGEGHQSQHLAKLCSRLHGLDISGKAIERARRRVPEAEFAVGDLATQPWGNERHRFDLVTACEVLYYIKDLPATIERMNYLGKACFVTFFAPAARRVGETLLSPPKVQRDWFYHGSTVWLACWWRND